MSKTYGDFSFFLVLYHPGYPGKRVAFQLLRDMRVRIVEVDGTEMVSPTWNTDEGSAWGTVFPVGVFSKEASKRKIKEYEEAGWVDCKNQNHYLGWS